MLSYRETNQLVNDVLNGKFNEDDELKEKGPELAGNIFMDKLDMCMIPFIYMLLNTLIFYLNILLLFILNQVLEDNLNYTNFDGIFWHTLDPNYVVKSTDIGTVQRYPNFPQHDV